MKTFHEKKRLRETARALRLALSPEDRARADAEIARAFLSCVEIAPAATVAGYCPVHGEADVRPLLSALAVRGHGVALPVMPEGKGPLSFHPWREGEPLAPGRFGVPAPDPAASPAIMPDVVLVPLLAFDAQGRRLGYGGGFYDRTFGNWPRGRRFLAVGIAYESQKLDEVPTGPYDCAMDIIVTEKQVYAAGVRAP